MEGEGWGMEREGWGWRGIGDGEGGMGVEREGLVMEREGWVMEREGGDCTILVHIRTYVDSVVLHNMCCCVGVEGEVGDFARTCTCTHR